MKKLQFDLRMLAIGAVLLFAGFALAADDKVAATTLPTATTVPATAPTTLPSDEDIAAAKARADKSRRKGMATALVGKFEEADGYFRLAGDTRALELLDEYIAKHRRDEAVRAAEYATAIRRISHSMLAQESIGPLAENDERGADIAQLVKEPDLSPADKVQDVPGEDTPSDDKEPGHRISPRLVKKMREHISDATEDLGEALTVSETVELAAPDELSDMRKTAEGNLARALTSLRAAAKLLAGRKDEYSVTFRAAVGEAETALADYRKMWADISSAEGPERHLQALELQLSMVAMGDVLGEIESMIAVKPWQRALAYGRMAVSLSIDSDHATEQQWYKQLVSDAEARGQNALDKAEWYDALSAYSGLSRLAPDDERYKRSSKLAERHVRVLELYGKGPGQSDDTASTRPSDGSRTWKDVVARVDKDMIQSVISRLANYYVESVDYRKVASGGLVSVKVLVETKQAANAFPGLKDDANRKAMIRSIEKSLEYIAKRDRVDEMDMKLVLNEVIYASEQTVHIPLAVLAVEFADGFLNELDRFSSMIWPYQMEEFDKSTMGRFCGIGVQIRKAKDKPLKAVSPLTGSPAHQAGIKAGDSILAVSLNGGEDWLETSGMTIEACVKAIMGKKGTKVVLRISRRNVEEPFEVTVTRDQISIHTVSGWRRRPDGNWDYMLDREARIGYIRIQQFTDTTAGDVIRALMKLHAEGVTSLVIDLRDNPGGLLRSAASVANQFLESGQIVSTKGRGGRHHSAAIKAEPSGAFLKNALVILVDQNSASAAEIVSGALKELGRAVIVGRRTYGKGSVQNVIPIPEHSASLKLTTAYYFVGNAEKLVHRRNGDDEWGVRPHVVARMTPRQRRRWLTIRSRTDLLQEIDANLLNGDLTAQFDSDIPLRTGVLLLKLRGITNGKSPM